jgi:hypothetical protein
VSDEILYAIDKGLPGADYSVRIGYKKSKDGSIKILSSEIAKPCSEDIDFTNEQLIKEIDRVEAWLLSAEFDFNHPKYKELYIQGVQDMAKQLKDSLFCRWEPR